MCFSIFPCWNISLMYISTHHLDFLYIFRKVHNTVITMSCKDMQQAASCITSVTSVFSLVWAYFVKYYKTYKTRINPGPWDHFQRLSIKQTKKRWTTWLSSSVDQWHHQEDKKTPWVQAIRTSTYVWESLGVCDSSTHRGLVLELKHTELLAKPKRLHVLRE